MSWKWQRTTETCLIQYNNGKDKIVWCNPRQTSSLAAKAQQSTGHAFTEGKHCQQPESNSFLVYTVAKIISDLQSTQQSRSSKKTPQTFKYSVLVLNKLIQFHTKLQWNLNSTPRWCVCDFSRSFRYTFSVLYLFGNSKFSVTLMGHVFSSTFIRIGKYAIFQNFPFLSSCWICVSIWHIFWTFYLQPDICFS